MRALSEGAAPPPSFGFDNLPLIEESFEAVSTACSFAATFAAALLPSPPAPNQFSRGRLPSEAWDDEEFDEEHVARQKPVLSDDMKTALALRAAQKKATPSFRRTEWFRYKRLSRSGWRKPHGMDNKQRRNFKYRGSLVRIGHGKVNAASGLHPSGFQEVMVHNTGDLDQIDAETQAARIGATVGGRKRENIHSRADELGIRVLNRRRDR